jgi:hypothetical protein
MTHDGDAKIRTAIVRQREGVVAKRAIDLLARHPVDDRDFAGRDGIANAVRPVGDWIDPEADFNRPRRTPANGD